jgi:ParB family chromosome partitioning protein
MDQSETYKSESKFTGLRIAPENLTIVGLDCDVSVCPELADPDRINLGTNFEELVLSIAAVGIRQAISIKKIGEYVCVVAGRRRVRAAREANKRLRKAGDENAILVPCVPEEKGKDLLTTLIVENVNRVEDSPIAKARKAQRLVERGITASKIGVIFGVSAQTVNGWLEMLGAPPETLAALERGETTATTAKAIAKLPAAKRAEAQKASVGKKGKAARAAVANRMSVNVSKRLSVSQIERLKDGLTACTTKHGPLAYAVVKFIQGDDTSLSSWPEIAKIAKKAIA